MTRVRAIAALLLVTAVFLVYRAGLHGPFVFDDYPNIVNHPLVSIQALDAESLWNAARSNESGPVGRPLAALSFALNYYFAGREFDPFAFKLVNVAIHAGNALLVLVLMSWLTPRLLPGSGAATRRWLPIAIALAWALHPIHLTSVLYVVQRMASLSATCVLLGLLLYVAGRDRLLAGRRGGMPLLLASAPLAIGVGLLFKENAVLFVLFAGVLELTVFRAAAATRAGRNFVLGWQALLLGLPAALFAAAIAMRPDLVTGAYNVRPFTLAERLLTESRVLFDYVGMLLAPRPQAFSLLHDDLLLSRGLLDPPVTALAVSGWMALLVGAAWSWARGGRVLPFALGWFLAGHALESGIFALELMHEHRNYVASLGVLAGVMLALAALLERIDAEPRLGTCVLLVLALVPLPITLSRAATWGNTEQLVARTVRSQPDSPRARLMAAQFEMVRGQLGAAHEQFRAAARLAPSDVTSLIAMQHIVSRLSLALAQGEMPADVVDPAEPLAPADALAELRLAPAYMAALADLLDRETGRRLASGSPASGDLSALRGMRRCIESGDPACVALSPRAVRWFESIAARDELSALRRSAAAADIGRVLARSQRLEEARNWLGRAWELAPVDLQILVLRGMLEAHMRDQQALARTRDQLAGREGHPGYKQSDLRKLESLLAELKAEGDAQ